MERLHKVLANAGLCSRRAAERLIEQGRVQVNGTVVTRLGSSVDPEQDSIAVDGKRLRSFGTKVYLLLNKPRGYVTTLKDPEGRPTVAELLEGVPGRVYPVGRLDFHSEGLLLVTNDGELANALMHPRHAVPKTYSVKVRGRPGRESLERLATGISIDGRRARAKQTRLVRPGRNSWLEVTVVEGRKHIVRKMLDAVGHPVLKLRRVRYGSIRLGSLGAGQWRHLTRAEVDRLRAAPERASQPPRRGRGRAS